MFVVEHQHRNLAQRVVADDFAVGRVRRVGDELAFHAFLDQNDAYLAGIGTGDRPDQLHHMDCFAKQINVKNAVKMRADYSIDILDAQCQRT